VHHKFAEELAQMSAILDSLPEVVELVHADLVRGNVRPEAGRPGMAAEQVLRALVLKQMNGFSYEELEFHIADSISFRAFCKIGEHDKSPSRSSLQENIKKITPETLERLNRALVEYASNEGIESGQKVRVDSTGVESNIHPPSDSSLLDDVVRTLVRLMKKGRRWGLAYHNRKKRSKRLAFRIFNAKTREDRRVLYQQLLPIVAQTLAEAQSAAEVLRTKNSRNAEELACALEHFIELGRRVVDQATRRVLQGETVPAGEKVVSIFEDHTDILVKGQREIVYGHKVFITSGASALLLDCVIEKGNPADSTLTVKMMDRQSELHGEPPNQAAFDGAFASEANLRALKERGVEDVMFSKDCGLDRAEMVSSPRVYQTLRNFRAGIEAGISLLKRCFGLTRCLWRGMTSFRAYVWSAIVSANLLLLARKQLTPAASA
jgi:IS5 family transposase